MGGNGPHGQIDAQAAAQGDTSGSVTGQFTLQFTVADFHLMPQPVFRYIPIQDPSVQLQLVADQIWQAQFGYTLLKKDWDNVTHKVSLGLQQAVSRQFGPSPAQSAWVMNILQGQGQVEISKVANSSLYLFAQGTFYGQRNDDGTWQAGFQATAGLGIQLEILWLRQ